MHSIFREIIRLVRKKVKRRRNSSRRNQKIIYLDTLHNRGQEFTTLNATDRTNPKRIATNEGRAALAAKDYLMQLNQC